MTATALWFDAWLRGSAGSDDLLEQLARSSPDAPARVAIDGVDHELSDLLRRRDPGLAGRVLLTSGDLAAGAIDKAAERTGCAMLAKPFDVESLHRAVNERLVDPR